jgi:homoserine dehydrogenase
LRRNGEEIARRAGRPIPHTWIAERCDRRRAREDARHDRRQPDRRRARGIGESGHRHRGVELIGGIEPARTFILEAIANGKHVVTANKALLARHGNEIFAAAHAKGVMVAFEAAVAGGHPDHQGAARGPLRQSHRVDCRHHQRHVELHPFRDARTRDDRSSAALRRGRSGLGYAEADPTLRHRGRIDAAHKLAIMSAIAFGVPMQFDKVYTEGISKLTQEDIRYAEELGYRIKLLGITRRAVADGHEGIELRVHPTLIPTKRLIANVEGVI